MSERFLKFGALVRVDTRPFHVVNPGPLVSLDPAESLVCPTEHHFTLFGHRCATTVLKITSSGTLGALKYHVTLEEAPV